ncbi:MAG TPA: hypothetical protein PK429_02120 [Candidatus Pacearchaeota archaeon]|jgi:hypothetical protein|nr:hypothetical protein [Candidatus Pacearchaeota archaeon]HPO06743.1 hypothetical protein [Candidatus Pacearchaeota archaeon]
MQFYHEIITQKSFVFLQGLKKEYEFVLIGGWAVFLYSHGLKSKDIDIIVGYSELAKMKEKYEVLKNERLAKYEIKTGEFDIDIYLSHYSDLGVDIVGIEESAVIKDGFLVPKLELLFLLKLFAWDNRRGTAKGRKDELDVFCLARLPEFDWKYYSQMVKKYSFEERHRLFIKLLKTTKEIKELAINQQKMAKLKKDILGKLPK